MLRILHYIPGFFYGGIESMFLSWYRNIDKNKISFELLLRTQDDNAPALKEYINLGGTFYRLPGISVNSIMNYIRAIDKFFDQHNKYDIVHVHESDPYIMSSIKRHGIKKIIIHSHTTSYGAGSIKGTIRFLDEQISIKKFADYAFTCSRLAAQWKFKGMSFKGNPVELIHNSIDAQKFRYSPKERNRIRFKLDIDKEFLLINIGRMTPQKNQFYLLDIFYEYQKINKNSILLIVGDGPDEKELKEYSAKKDLMENVLFLGVRDDVPELLQAADCFLLPSRWEGFPVTLVEAQASGLPCFISDRITSEVNIIKEVYRLDINKSAAIWAKEIEKRRVHFERKDNFYTIVSAGFDTKTETMRLIDKYYSIARKSKR